MNDNQVTNVAPLEAPESLEKRGPGQHRTPQQRLLNRMEMVKLMRRGWSKQQIAEHLGLTMNTINRDWGRILADLSTDHDENTQALVKVKLEEYAEVKREAWEAWERSKKYAIEQVEESKIAPSGRASSSKKRKIANQAGDPRFLHQVLQCLESERTLQNLDPIKQVSVTANVINWDALTSAVSSGDLNDVIEGQIEAAVRGEEYLLPSPDHDTMSGESDETRREGDTNGNSRTTSYIHQESSSGDSESGSVPLKKKWVYANVEGKRVLVEDRSGL